MKKSILSRLPLAIAITGALAAGGAQAVTVYETEDSYLKLTGEVAFEFVRDVDEGDQTESKTDNIDLEVTAGYILENGAHVYGYYAMEFAGLSAQNDGTDFLKDHYIAYKQGGLNVKYGDQDYAVDDFAIRKNLDAKTATERVLNPDDSERNLSKNVLYVSYKGERYFVSASHDLTIDGNDEDERETGFDLFAKGEVFDSLWLGATYSKQDYYTRTTAGDDDGGEYDSYGVQVEYLGFEDLTLGASWFFGENFLQKTKGSEFNNEATGYDLSAKYKINSRITVAAGYGLAMPDSDNEFYDEDMATWYLNANYNVRKNLDLYGEIYDEDNDKEKGEAAGNQLGFVVGISLDF